MVGPMESTRFDEKLIRGKIPANVLAREGVRLKTRAAAEGEKPGLLRRKIAEETGELARADAESFVAEMADVRQALADFCVVAGIRPATLAVPETNGVPVLAEERVRFFRSQVERVRDLGAAVPEDPAEATEHVTAMLATIGTITHVAGIRDAVRAALAEKFEQSGGFLDGVVLVEG